MGGHFLALVCILQVVSGSNLVPHQRDYHVSDYITQTVMDELSNELSVEANGYLGMRDTSPGQETKQTPVTKDVLPAYCSPPNPCPVGYTVEETFENTAAFSRDLQHSQKCMCASEQMMQCSDTDHHSQSKDYYNNMFLDKVTEELSGKEHRNNLVSNKYHFEKNNNPFFVGDRLPVAAKKGIHLYGG